MKHEPDLIVTEHDGSQWVPIDCYRRINDELEHLREECGEYWAIAGVRKEELDYIRKLYYTAKHNRDVELTDLLTCLLERYGDLMTPQDRERIEELTKPL